MLLNLCSGTNTYSPTLTGTEVGLTVATGCNVVVKPNVSGHAIEEIPTIESQDQTTYTPTISGYGAVHVGSIHTGVPLAQQKAIGGSSIGITKQPGIPAAFWKQSGSHTVVGNGETLQQLLTVRGCPECLISLI